jgi:hypothetical protein
MTPIRLRISAKTDPVIAQQALTHRQPFFNGLNLRVRIAIEGLPLKLHPHSAGLFPIRRHGQNT